MDERKGLGLDGVDGSLEGLKFKVYFFSSLPSGKTKSMERPPTIPASLDPQDPIPEPITLEHKHVRLIPVETFSAAWEVLTPEEEAAASTESSENSEIEKKNPSVSALRQLYHAASDPSLWTYMLHGPFSNLKDFKGWLLARSNPKLKISAGNVPTIICFLIFDKPSNSFAGSLSAIAIDYKNRRSIPPPLQRAEGMEPIETQTNKQTDRQKQKQIRRFEIGGVWIGKKFQRSYVNTESIYLLLDWGFSHLHCRRIEWKTDTRNVESQRAFERLGGTREGVFRKHLVQKGFNRDTVWYSIIDSDWIEGGVKERIEALMLKYEKMAATSSRSSSSNNNNNNNNNSH